MVIRTEIIKLRSSLMLRSFNCLNLLSINYLENWAISRKNQSLSVLYVLLPRNETFMIRFVRGKQFGHQRRKIVLGVEITYFKCNDVFSTFEARIFYWLTFCTSIWVGAHFPRMVSLKLFINKITSACLWLRWPFRGV